jgi:protein involved in polysaccharide export with SLBB domain
MAEKARLEMIRRLETTPISYNPGISATGTEIQSTMQAMQQQQQQLLVSLRSYRASGRQVITISGDIASWENTPADVEVRAGDVLIIPKRPNFVTISGQVYNAAAITYVPGRTVGQYLREAGGPTDMANKKNIFVVRADGSVISQGGGGWFKGNVLNARVSPGDNIVVPERIIGGSQFWKNLMSIGQFMSGIGLTAAVVANNL